MFHKKNLIAFAGLLFWQSMLYILNHTVTEFIYYEFTRKLILCFCIIHFTTLGVGVFNFLVFELFLLRRLGIKAPALLKNFVNVLLWVLSYMCTLLFVFNNSDFSFLLAGSSISLAIVSFIMRSLVSDFFSGIIIGVDKAVSIGDRVGIGEGSNRIEGVIEDMNWRSTKLLNTDNSRILIPNTNLASEVVTNYAYARAFEHSLSLYIDIRASSHLVESLLLSAILVQAEVLDTKENPVKIRIQELDKEYVLWEVRFCLAAQANASHIKHTIWRRILKHLKLFALLPFEKELDRLSCKMLLNSNEIFQSFSKQQVRHLDKHAHIHYLLKDEVLFEQGSKGDSFYMIAQGLLSVLIDEGVEVAKLSTGDFAGEMALLTGQPRNATLKAVVPTQVFEIKSQHLKEVLDEDSMRAMSEVLARRVFETEKKQRSKELEDKNATEQKEHFAKQFFSKISSLFA